MIKKGCLLFSPQNLWLGNINLNTEFEIAMVSPSYKIYEIKDTINPRWLISILKSPKLMYEYKLVSEQGASVVRRNLDLKRFLEIIIEMPENQNQIGSVLNLIEEKIKTLTLILLNIRKMKVSLLKEMFI